MLLFDASSAYFRRLLQSMFLLTFHAYLRIGEIIVHSDTIMATPSFNFPMLLLVIQALFCQLVTISQTSDAYCPVHALSQFLKLRVPLTAHCLLSLILPQCPVLTFASISQKL